MKLHIATGWILLAIATSVPAHAQSLDGAINAAVKDGDLIP